MSTTDSDHVNYSDIDKSGFVDGMKDAIVASKNTSDGKLSLSEIFKKGRAKDKPENIYASTSIDYFIEKKLAEKAIKNCINCVNFYSPIKSVLNEIREFDYFFKKIKDDRKFYYEKHIKLKLEEIQSELDSLRIQYSEWSRKNVKKKVDDLKVQWTSFSEEKKKIKRSEFTELVESLKEEDSYQRKKIDDLKIEHQRALNEARFLKDVSSKDLEEYLAIRECLDYEL